MMMLDPEEASFMGVIKFIYNSKSLSSTDAPDYLLQVLLAADKFSVPSCVNYCCKILMSIPMTAELALCYIDLPSIISVNEIQPLLNVANDFLPNILKDIPKYHKDIISLSLEGIKIILSHHHLKVHSEDEAYDLLVEWTEEHFPDSEEQQRILNAEMLEVIRLQNMSTKKLKRVLGKFFSSHHFDETSVEFIMEAILIDENKSSLPTHPRAYERFPVSAMTFKFPVKQCVVFFDLKRQDCKDATFLPSQAFKLDGNVFHLMVQPNKNETDENSFGVFLFLCGVKKRSDVGVHFQFAVRQKSSPREFVRLKQTSKVTFLFEETDVGYGEPDLFDAPWEDVMHEDSDFFIDGTMHLRLDLTLVGED